MDWNWFFSSLAQSVAAIVGIFAAFIITKVINNQNDFSKKKSRLQELLTTTEKYQEEFLNRYIVWYYEDRLDSSLNSLKEELEKEERKSAEDYYTQLNFPLFIPRKDVLEKINLEIENFISESHRPQRNLLREISIMPSPELQQMQFQRKLQHIKDVEVEGELINNLITEIKHHTKIAKLHLTEIEENPESSKLVSHSIISAFILFLIGVVCPLFFLPVFTSKDISIAPTIYFCIKIVLLTAILIIFLFIIWQFWRTNNSLKYDERDVKKLRKAAQLKSYSKYLEIMENNLKEIQRRKEELNKSQSKMKTENEKLKKETNIVGDNKVK